MNVLKPHLQATVKTLLGKGSMRLRSHSGGEQRGIVASSQDTAFATFAGFLSSFVDNRRRWPFCVAASGFCGLADRYHGCNIFDF